MSVSHVFVYAGMLAGSTAAGWHLSAMHVVGASHVGPRKNAPPARGGATDAHRASRRMGRTRVSLGTKRVDARRTTLAGQPPAGGGIDGSGGRKPSTSTSTLASFFAAGAFSVVSCGIEFPARRSIVSSVAGCPSTVVLT